MKARDRVGGDARDRGEGRSWGGRREPVLRAHARDEGERAGGASGAKAGGAGGRAGGPACEDNGSKVTGFSAAYFLEP